VVEVVEVEKALGLEVSKVEEIEESEEVEVLLEVEEQEVNYSKLFTLLIKIKDLQILNFQL